LKIKSEAYPKSKLAEIAASESKETEFNNWVTKAEKAFADNNFDEALNSFTEALKLKPSDTPVKKRIEDIQSLKNNELAEKEYAGLITQADQNFNNNQFDEAITAYNKALQLKKSETYPKAQLKKIDSYQSLVTKAEKSFQSKDYSASLISLNSILELKSNDGYAKAKIAEIEKIQSDQKQMEEKANAELLAYNEAIKVADQLFNAQSYPESMTKYKDALAIKANETYPPKRIKEIENILDKAEKEKARMTGLFHNCLPCAWIRRAGYWRPGRLWGRWSCHS
jgi:tetratricopeptide (TPR) repeat protein